MDSKQYQGCVLAVADSNFRVVSPNWDRIGKLSVLLPWTLASAAILTYSHEVSLDTFGATGVN